ncbi:MAG TPA: D-glycerate dehydrogenase [Desulfobacteraceae bacterium]|nr:D-glycerate dehydrogenase [Desulfobacteraceae bacterium]|tara:strand:+ start:176 stop:1195 length:1020 start_codon:yes stop_codon:yes gene_type:complete
MTSPDQIKILVTRKFPDIGTDILTRHGFRLTQWPQERPMTYEQLRSRVPGHQALFCTLTDRIDRDLIRENPQLQLISQFAVGYDNIDIRAATKACIPVGFTPDVMSEATADIAFGLMIATARKMFYHHKRILDGGWQSFTPCGHLGMELTGKTLGIFGMGRIGKKMARRCAGAYDMEIIYHSRSRHTDAEAEFGARKVTFNELLAQSDVISVHSVLSPETRGIFDAAAFAGMKSSALFINTARGPIHNETDLLSALEDGEIQGAGLDVTDPEPMDKTHPLLNMENVCILPHIGSGTREARDDMARLAAENIVAFFTTGKLVHAVNPEVSGSNNTTCDRQ